MPLLNFIALAVRELSARYSSEIFSSKVRKLRASKDWLNRTFNLEVLLIDENQNTIYLQIIASKDESRVRLEDAEVLEYMHS